MTNVLWDRSDQNGVVVESEERMLSTFRAHDLLRSGSTVGELRRADLPDWARRVVEAVVEGAEEEGDTVTDDTPWDYPSDMLAEGSFIPLPDEYGAAVDWLGEEFLREHADYLHATSPMDVDRYRVRDKDLFLAALQGRGFTIQHRPGLMADFRSNL
jgi:hypothetical protein